VHGVWKWWTRTYTHIHTRTRMAMYNAKKAEKISTDHKTRFDAFCRDSRSRVRRQRSRGAHVSLILTADSLSLFSGVADRETRSDKLSLNAEIIESSRSQSFLYRDYESISQSCAACVIVLKASIAIFLAHIFYWVSVPSNCQSIVHT